MPASVVRFATAWNDSFAVWPITASSSSAEPMPGTCTRIRSAPWRWIDGSRVPVSSTRRRMISRLCCMVRASIAVRSAGVRVTTSVSPSALTSNSRLDPPVSENTGCASACTASSAAAMPAGWLRRMCSSSAGPFSRRTVPTSSRRSRRRSRRAGHSPSMRSV